MKELAPAIAWAIAIGIMALHPGLGTVAVTALIAYGFGQVFSNKKDH